MPTDLDLAGQGPAVDLIEGEDPAPPADLTPDVRGGNPSAFAPEDLINANIPPDGDATTARPLTDAEVDALGTDEDDDRP